MAHTDSTLSPLLRVRASGAVLALTVGLALAGCSPIVPAPSNDSPGEVQPSADGPVAEAPVNETPAEPAPAPPPRAHQRTAAPRPESRCWGQARSANNQRARDRRSAPAQRRSRALAEVGTASNPCEPCESSRLRRGCRVGAGASDSSGGRLNPSNPPHERQLTTRGRGHFVGR